MKKINNEFKIGDRVGRLGDMHDDDGKKIKLRFDADYAPEFGVVTDFSEAGKVIVKWDPPVWNPKRIGEEEVVPCKDLVPEAPLKETWSKLEAEFDVLEKEVSNKLKEAGKLLREANKLAKKSGRELAEMYDAIDPLYSAMDDCGWRTSSFGC